MCHPRRRGCLAQPHRCIDVLLPSCTAVLRHRSNCCTAVLQAYGQVDEDGSRFLLSDFLGNLHLLLLLREGASSTSTVSALKLEPLGRTPAASTISYLDSGVVFVGSSFGDSQLIRWVGWAGCVGREVAGQGAVRRLVLAGTQVAGQPSGVSPHAIPSTFASPPGLQKHTQQSGFKSVCHGPVLNPHAHTHIFFPLPAQAALHAARPRAARQFCGGSGQPAQPWTHC